MGLTYTDMKSVLGSRNGFNISEKHLKRLVSERGLSRKGYSDLAKVRLFLYNLIVLEYTLKYLESVKDQGTLH